jgi:hypothetical protein
MVVPFTGTGACATAMPAPAVINIKATANFPRDMLSPSDAKHCYRAMMPGFCAPGYVGIGGELCRC